MKQTSPSSDSAGGADFFSLPPFAAGIGCCAKRAARSSAVMAFGAAFAFELALPFRPPPPFC